MTRTTFALLLGATLSLSIPACGSGDDPARFQKNFEEAVKAAEQGKQLVKSPVARRRR